MGLFGRIVIALLLSTPVLCQNPSRKGLASILQNILTSNPQILKMGSNRQLCDYSYEAPITTVQGQYISNYQGQRKPTVIEMPYPVQSSPCYQSPVPIQPLPVQPVASVQPTVSQQVQTVSQSYLPSVCPSPYVSPAALVNPFLPAASPVSAMAPPTSNLLPSVIPSINKHHFLRKVPFPPPCI